MLWEIYKPNYSPSTFVRYGKLCNALGFVWTQILSHHLCTIWKMYAMGNIFYGKYMNPTLFLPALYGMENVCNDKCMLWEMYAMGNEWTEQFFPQLCMLQEMYSMGNIYQVKCIKSTILPIAKDALGNVCYGKHILWKKYEPNYFPYCSVGNGKCMLREMYKPNNSPSISVCYGKWRLCEMHEPNYSLSSYVCSGKYMQWEMYAVENIWT